MTHLYKHFIVAFGSNLNAADFNDYASKKGNSGECLHFICPVKIPDYKLVFNASSIKRKGGVLSIERSLGCVTEAGLFSATDEGLSILRKKEGVPNKYEEIEIVVIGPEGQEIQALTYVIPEKRSEGFVRPHPEYLETCEKGLESRGIYDLENLHAAARNEKIKPLPTIFSYGTLMRGQSRFSTVKKHGLRAAMMAQCRGSLSTNGIYPALNFGLDGCVWGDYYLSRNIVSLLQDTDKIEGFYGFGSSKNLFRRTITEVCTGRRIETVWTYVMDKKLIGDVPYGDWRRYNGSRSEFIDKLLKDHSSGDDRFLEKVTGEYYGWKASPDKKSLNFDDLRRLLTSEDGELTEQHIGRISNCWVAAVDF